MWRSASSETIASPPRTGAAHGAPRAAHGCVHRLLTTDLIAIDESRCAGGATSPVQTVSASDHYEIVIARRGAFARETFRGRRIAHQGVALVSAPGEPYRITHPVAGGDLCSVFRVPVSGMHAMLGQDDAAQGTAHTSAVDDVGLDGDAYLRHALAVRAAKAAGTDAGPCRLAAEERALRFLDVLGAAVRAQRARRGRSTAREARNANAREYAMRVREVIARRYHEPLTLVVIARAVGCSPYHLSRIVTAYEGVPIYRLVIRHRLRAALEPVLDGTASLSAIAFDAGFASQSHFGDAFRREFGCPPGVARRRGRCA